MTAAALLMWFFFFALTIYGHVAMKHATSSVTAEGIDFFWALAKNIWAVTAVIGWLAAGLIWMVILKKQPLMQAQSIAALTYVLICLSAIAFLGESISSGKAVGMALIAAGIYFVAR
jgi:drug/metabolite transporter (DMT)-like permease